MVISGGPPCHSVVVDPLSPLSLSSYTHSAPTIPPSNEQLLISMGVGHSMGWVWTALAALLLGHPVIVGGGATSVMWWSSRVRVWDGIGGVITGSSCHRAVSVTWRAYEDRSALTLRVCHYLPSSFIIVICHTCTVCHPECMHGPVWGVVVVKQLVYIIIENERKKIYYGPK